MVRQMRKHSKKDSFSFHREDERLDKLDWLPGNCKFGLCGEDAACIPGPNLTHKCVCPSDLSAPTLDGKLCLTRKTVPLTPRPILNININGKNISPWGNRSQTFHQIGNLTAVRSRLENSDEYLFGLIGLFLVFASFLAGLFYCWKKKSLSKCVFKSAPDKADTNVSPLSLSKGLLGSYVPNPQYVANDVTPVPVLPRDTLGFIQEIGEGCFGKVFKGELKKEDGTVETVAVKVLKETATRQAEEDFMREVEIMSAFRHENILSLLGIVLKDGSSRPWMVFEFMPHGDLAEVLRSNSRQFWKPVPGLKSLTMNSLLKIALQIAGGMKYLASQRFVHNDLACRNCLVGSELTVKIADFGMSRDIYTCDYYRIGGSKPVPLRWLSPESVMYRRFTLESDVWSYGVVLWEIYSFGKQPYYGLSNEEVVKMILQGIMLIPPDTCPLFVCDLMRACWKSEPKDRIKFHEIYDQLKKAWKERGADRSPHRIPPSNVKNFQTFSSSPCLPPDSAPNQTADVSCPRPPLFPVSPFQTQYSEMLDADNYLTPQATQINEYIHPIPD